MDDRELLENELAELEAIHAKLDNAVDQGHSNYMSDPLLVKLKQERLTIKRSIEHIKEKLVNS